MKSLVMALILVGPFTFALAKNCKEDVLGAAIQMEALRPDATDFTTPVADPKNPSVVSSQGNEVTWLATIVGNDGRHVGYFVKTNKTTCEVLEAPVRSRK